MRYLYFNFDMSKNIKEKNFILFAYIILGLAFISLFVNLAIARLTHSQSTPASSPNAPIVVDADLISSEVSDSSAISILMSKLQNIQSKIEKATYERLPFYHTLVGLSRKYNQLIGWNYVSYGEYNGVTTLSDGMLTTQVPPRDVTANALAVADLSKYCEENGAKFLYVQAPHKINPLEDADISGFSDFSNQNADALLKELEAYQVDYLDLRAKITEDNLAPHSLFYKTDHHWTLTTGIWASEKILEYCNSKYIWNANLSKLDINNFDLVTYPDLFLGSQGKKVSLLCAAPEDFVVPYPKYETLFSYKIPELQMDCTGDYSICYDKVALEKGDYYKKNPYAACNYGDRALIQITNQLEADGHSILFVHDSFGDCVLSALALAEKEVTALDLRYYNGDLKSYIEKHKPDLVIMLYNAGTVGGENFNV